MEEITSCQILNNHSLISFLPTANVKNRYVEVVTKNNVTKVKYYRTIIAVINHNEKTAKFNNGGYTNAATTARINAAKKACDYFGYNY